MKATLLFALGTTAVLHLGCIRQALALQSLRKAGYQVRFHATETKKRSPGNVQLDVPAALYPFCERWNWLADLYGTPMTVVYVGQDQQKSNVTREDLYRLAALHAEVVQIVMETPLIDDTFAEILSQSRRTKTIFLSPTEITNVGAARLFSMSGVTGIHLQSKLINDEMIVPDMPHAQPIDICLWYTSIGDRVVMRLLETREIEHLSLDGTLVSDQCAEALARETSLRSLSVGESLLSAKALSVIARNASLQEILLEGMPIDDAAARAFAQLPKLRILLSRHSDVSEAHLETMLHNPSLEWVTVQAPSVSDAFIAHMRAEHPQIRIFVGNKPWQIELLASQAETE